MASEFNIQLIPHEEMESIISLVYETNKRKIAPELLKSRLKDMLKMDCYECAGVYDDKELIGICGIWILNKFYVGKHIEPDNVFIKEAYRNQGIGELLLNWVCNYAKEIGCEAAEVNFYASNTKGRKFWKRQGFEPVAFHGIKTFNKKENE